MPHDLLTLFPAAVRGRALDQWKGNTMAQVHRFHDSVAVHVGKGETVYFSAKDARKLARALHAVALSCERESFAESRGLTVHVPEPARA